MSGEFKFQKFYKICVLNFFDIKSLNPIPVGGGVLSTPPYSFIVLTHIKVKQMTSNDLTIPLWQ